MTLTQLKSVSHRASAPRFMCYTLFWVKIVKFVQCRGQRLIAENDIPVINGGNEHIN